jgi:tRNA threonylcarbamoyladenosine biosynthesis protein TsaB
VSGAIVGLDTATPSTAVAVLRADGRGAEARDDPPPGERPAHASRLLELMETALRQAGASWDDVGRIAVGVGPGGFTGLRIGVATARALAQARGLEVVPVGSLHALALGAAGESSTVVPVIDARRGEAFAAAFAEGGSLWGPLALPPEGLAARVPAGALAVGDGAVRFRDQLERAGAVVPADGSPLHRLSAVHVCRLGAAGEPVDRDALVPDYVREPDAKPPR